MKDKLLRKVMRIANHITDIGLNSDCLSNPYYPSSQKKYKLHSYYTKNTDSESCLLLEQIGIRILVPTEQQDQQFILDYNSVHKSSMLHKNEKVVKSLFENEFEILMDQSILKDLVVFHLEGNFEKRDSYIDYLVNSKTERKDKHPILWKKIENIPHPNYNKKTLFLRDVLIVKTLTISQLLKKKNIKPISLVDSKTKTKIQINKDEEKTLFQGLEEIGIKVTPSKKENTYYLDSNSIRHINKKMNDKISPTILYKQIHNPKNTFVKQILHKSVYKFMIDPHSLGKTADDVCDLYLWNLSLSPITRIQKFSKSIN